MPKRTALMILLLSSITGMLLYAALTMESKPSTAKSSEVEKVVPSKKDNSKDAELYFSPSTLTVSVSSQSAALVPTHAIDIYINSHSNAVTGVQLELAYDPSVLSNVSIISPSEVGFFGMENEFTVVFQDVDKKNGRISYAVEIKKDNLPRIGVGKVATIYFSLNKTIKPDILTSQISFINKSMILKLDSRTSVLDKVVPLTLELQRGNTTAPRITPSIGISPTVQQIHLNPTSSTIPSIMVSPKENRNCIQIIQFAVNPSTGECREFPTPCDVPEGWNKVNSCETL